jgi:hypothetical protein
MSRAAPSPEVGTAARLALGGISYTHISGNQVGL